MIRITAANRQSHYLAYLPAKTKSGSDKGAPIVGTVSPENKGSAPGSYGFEAMNGAFY
jgi:hypothetical protein